MSRGAAYNARAKSRYAVDKDKPGFRERHRIYKRRSYEKHREKRVAYGRLWRQKQRELKAGRPKPALCEACCEQTPEVVWDHCHATGKFRGWLCNPCNLSIGLMKENPARLRAVADYLERITKCAGSS